MTKDQIFRAHQRGQMSTPEACRMLREIDDPPSQLLWTLLVISVLCLGAAVVAGVVRG